MSTHLDIDEQTAENLPAVAVGLSGLDCEPMPDVAAASSPTGGAPTAFAGERGEIRRALVDGIADGFRRHVPATVGILARGLAVMLLVVIAHYVFGLSLGSISVHLAGAPFSELSIS